jgi:hypothetical protein
MGWTTKRRYVSEEEKCILASWTHAYTVNYYVDPGCAWCLQKYKGMNREQLLVHPKFCAELCNSPFRKVFALQLHGFLNAEDLRDEYFRQLQVYTRGLQAQPWISKAISFLENVCDVHLGDELSLEFADDQERVSMSLNGQELASVYCQYLWRRLQMMHFGPPTDDLDIRSSFIGKMPDVINAVNVSGKPVPPKTFLQPLAPTRPYTIRATHTGLLLPTLLCAAA